MAPSPLLGHEPGTAPQHLGGAGLAQLTELATATNVALGIGVPVTATWYLASGAVVGAAQSWSEGVGAAAAGIGVWLSGHVLWEITRRSYLRWYPKVALSLTPLR